MGRYALDGRIIGITGSTGGLGAALSQGLLAKGARLALFDIDGDAAQAQARTLGPNAHSWKADVRSLPELEQAMNEAARHFGGVDVVIANAGCIATESLATGSPERFAQVVDVNLLGVWRTFRAALPHVQERRGYLMAISSMAAFVHSPLQASYCASKAGVWAMCDSVRLELRHLGVDVGCVHPTFFQTPLMQQVFDDPAGNRIWRGNKEGIWKMVPIESVVTAVVRGIETRAEFVTAPGPGRLIARAPGVFRRLLERIGFSDAEIAETVAMAARHAGERTN
jgi:NAD(P)-dependent dehydrogenase (short-subunit alcohol dehydrogenase family)